MQTAHTGALAAATLHKVKRGRGWLPFSFQEDDVMRILSITSQHRHGVTYTTEQLEDTIKELRK